MEDLLDGVLVVVAGDGGERVVLDGLLDIEAFVADGALVFVNWHESKSWSQKPVFCADGFGNRWPRVSALPGPSVARVATV